MNELLLKVMDMYGIVPEMQIVPAPFCAVLHIDNDRYTQGATALKAESMDIRKKKRATCGFCKLSFFHPLNGLVVLKFSAFQRYVALISVRSCYCNFKMNTTFICGVELSKSQLFYYY